MNAAQPVPTSAVGEEARPAEPSMEEILASIRRIIADDQTHAVEPEPATPTRRSHDEPVSETKREIEPFAALAPREPEPAAQEPMIAQGSVAAPQYPMPEPAPAAAPRPVTVRADEATTAHSVPPIRHEAIAERIPDEPHRAETGREPVAEREAGAPLFSSATHKSVTSAFNVLAASRLAGNSDELLGMAREMIRPMLRAWLDENLPVMVERMVRDEIERVSRGV